MMGKLARIFDGVVTNVIIGDEFPGYQPVPDDVAIGWHYNGGVFSPAPKPAQVMTLDDRKAAALAELHAQHDAVLRELGGNTTPENREARQAQWAAARAMVAGTATDDEADMLAVQAAMSGVALDELTASLVKENKLFLSLVAQASGHQTATANAINAAQDERALLKVLVAARARAAELTAAYLASLNA